VPPSQSQAASSLISPSTASGILGGTVGPEPPSPKLSLCCHHCLPLRYGLRTAPPTTSPHRGSKHSGPGTQPEAQETPKSPWERLLSVGGRSRRAGSAYDSAATSPQASRRLFALPGSAGMGWSQGSLVLRMDCHSVLPQCRWPAPGLRWLLRW
jgi:hypothetical protein